MTYGVFSFGETVWKEIFCADSARIAFWLIREELWRFEKSTVSYFVSVRLLS